MTSRRLQIIFCAVFFVFLMPSATQAASRFWVGSAGGNWNDTANWSTVQGSCGASGGASVPGSSDTASFTSSCTNDALMDSTVSIGGMNIASGYTGTITQGSGVTVTVAASNWTQAGGTFTGSNSAITIASSFTLSSGTFNAPSGTLSVALTWTKSGGTFNAGTGTVALTRASGTQNFNSGGASYYDIIHSGAGTMALVTNSLTVTHSFTNSAGTFSLAGIDWIMTGATFSNTGTVQLQGNETITGLTQDTTKGTWRYAGRNVSENFTIKDFGTTDYFNLTINDANATKATFQSGSALVVGNALTVTAGTFDANGQTTTVNASTSTAVVTTVSGGTYLASTALQTFGRLTVSGGTFTGSSGGVSVVNALILSSGTLTAPSGTFTITGTWAQSGGTFTPGTNTVTFDKSTGTTQTLNSGGSSFYNIVHSGTVSLQLLTNALTVTHSFTNSAGTFDLNGLNWTMTGATLSNAGTVQLQGIETITGLTQDTTQGTWKYVGRNIVETITLADFGATDYAALTIADNNSNRATFQLGSDLTITGAFAVSPATFNANGQTATIAGVTSVTGGSTYSASTATQTFTGGLTVAGGTFTGSSGNVAAGDVTLSTGILTAPSGSFTVSGDWIRSSGTFTVGTGTVTLNGTNQDISGSTTFYNLTKTVSSADTLTFEAGSTQTISGILTLSGAASNLLSLRSSVPGSIWTIASSGSRSLAYLDVQDSTNSDSTVMNCATTACVDSENNTNWLFTTVTTTAVSSSLNPAGSGDPVVLTATVTPAAATGYVTFYDGATSIGTQYLISGIASIIKEDFTIRDHSITAVYAGDSIVDGSTSNTLTQVVSGGTGTGFVSITNESLIWSPYNWYFNGSSYAQATAGGAYVKIAFTGSSLAIGIDDSHIIGFDPDTIILHAYIDGSTTAIEKDLSEMSGNLLTITSSLSRGKHYAIIYLAQTGFYDRWSIPANSLRITKFQLDPGGTVYTLLKTPLGERSQKIIIYGDSITEGTGNTSAEYSYAAVMAQQLDMEYGQLGYSSLGWGRNGGGGLPYFYDSSDLTASQWRMHDNTHSRLVNNNSVSSGFVDGAPDGVFVNLGINDVGHSPDMQGKITSWLQEIRSAIGTEPAIFMVVPFNYGDTSNAAYQTYRTAWLAGISDYLAAYPTDSRVFTLDLGTSAFDTVAAHSSDGLHPDDTGAAILGAELADLAEASLETTAPATVEASPAPSGGSPSSSHTSVAPDASLQDSLQKEIARLQALIQTLMAGSSPTPLGSPSLTKTFQPGDIDPEVKALQQLLNHLGFTIASSGPGSPGRETNIFGALTKQAVMKFQEHYASEILTPAGFTKPTGMVGPLTRAKLTALSTP